jgi:protein involved in polysaccharide export with SLBB domain
MTEQTEITEKTEKGVGEISVHSVISVCSVFSFHSPEQLLSEYIREPKVSIQIAQVHSLKYMVIGDVTQPGIYEMTRRMTVTEALAKAGYVTRFGDLSKVSVLRMQKDGVTAAMPVNMKEIERGKIADVYLIPGDTVFVPGNKFKTVDKLMSITMLASWMRIIAR